jgi:hypothetical protein
MDLGVSGDLVRVQPIQDPSRSIAAPREENGIHGSVAQEGAVAVSALGIASREEALHSPQIGGLDDAIPAPP